MARVLALSLAASLLLAASPARADDLGPLLPRRQTSALDRALWLGRPEPLPVMGKAGGTALMIVGSIMVGGGWLVANTGLLVHSRAEDPPCADGDVCVSGQQKVGIGMMIGGAVVCMSGVPLMIYGAAVRERETPRRGPSRWGTGRALPPNPLSFSF